MNTNNYLPFDLEIALKHPERVVTRDGRKIEQLVFLDKADKEQECIVAVHDGRIYELYNSGKFVTDPHRNDLFLLPEVKECWVNVYDVFGKINVGGSYKTLEECNKKIIKEDRYKYIKTIRITNEPDLIP